MDVGGDYLLHSRQDEELLDLVRPFFREADSEGELAYPLWRRGLEVTLGEALSFGASRPNGLPEASVAGLVAQRLLLSMPLLRRTGRMTPTGRIRRLPTSPLSR